MRTINEITGNQCKQNKEDFYRPGNPVTKGVKCMVFFQSETPGYTHGAWFYGEVTKASTVKPEVKVIKSSWQKYSTGEIIQIERWKLWAADPEPTIEGKQMPLFNFYEFEKPQ